MASWLDDIRDGLPSSEDTGESRLTQQLEEMRIRMNDLARREHEMTAELDTAVRGMDEQLLQEVRSIGAAHAARRANILHELQMLAARLDQFPQQARQQPLMSAASQSLPPSAHVGLQGRFLEPHDVEQEIRNGLSRYAGR